MKRGKVYLQSLLLMAVAVLLSVCQAEPVEDATALGSSPVSPIVPAEQGGREACEPASRRVGAVVGELHLHEGAGPSAGSYLYLGRMEGEESGFPLVSMDPSTSPNTITDEEGRFCINNVEPGAYGLIIWNAVDSVLLADPQSGYTYRVEVSANQVTDVGRVFTPVP